VEENFKIRLINKSDDPYLESVIKDVMTEFGAVGEGYSIEDDEVRNMYGAYSNPRAAYFVIEFDGVVLGGAGIGPLIGGDDDVCELKKMYFRPSLRGMGLGKRLMDLCLDAAKERGYKKCYLETLARMPQARGLYIKYGFTPIDAPMGCTGHFNCENWYIKDL
jgi:putative acetyltransferase